jgi:aspartyl/asparaginyl beta-hydroxylase (cupin superfamily)
MNKVLVSSLIFVILGCVYRHINNPYKWSPGKMKPLQDNWRTIANEASTLPENIIDGPVTHRIQEDWLGDDGLAKIHEQFKNSSGWIYGWQADIGGPNREWMNWGLIFNGKPCGKNADICPATTELLKSIPGIQVAGFSMMMPRSKLNPHTDATGKKFGSMAYHLGLDCPKGCNMVIGDKKECEKNGKSFIFDATSLHWAENTSDSPRMILYIDYKI